MPLSTHSVRLGTASLVLALVTLAGCADGESTPTPAAAGGPSSTPSATAPAFPVMVEHRYGTTTIEKASQRIVVAGLVEQDALLALGVVPVATTEWYGEQPGAIFPWATDELGDAPLPTVLSFTDGIAHEAIAAQRPDLILGLYSGMTRADYDKLSRIAPTIAQPTDVDYEVTWQGVTATVGAAVGRAAEAGALVAETEQLFADARAAHPQFAEQSAVLVTPFEGYGVYGREDPRSRILTDLGFSLPAELDEIVGDSFFGNLSRERLDLLDTDIAIWYVESPDQVQDIREDDIYANLAVSKEDRSIFLDDDGELYDPFGFVSVLSLPVLLEGLLPLLVAAGDGDPSTTIPEIS